MTDPTFHQPARTPRSPGQVASIIGGVLAGLVALVLLAVGGLALWGDGQADKAGYISTSAHPFSAPGRAIVSDDLDVDLDGLGSISSDVAGRVRLRVDSGAGAPLFVGIARTNDVSRYLRGVERRVVTDVEFKPFRADYDSLAGDRRPAAPGAQGFWAASSEGTGTRALNWRVRDGSWSVVVMNADASPGVDVDLSAGAKLPFLGPLGWVGVGGGLVLLAVAGLLLGLGLRAPRAPAGGPSVAAPGTHVLA
jgi:hypothetical protein